MFDPYLLRWSLVPDGDPITTPAARLLPVLLRGEPAMLKLSCEEEERHGGVLMEWWDGEGAARVLALDETALLLERAVGLDSLADMARAGAMTRPAASCAPQPLGCTLQGQSRFLS